MDVSLAIRRRLKDLGLEQRSLAAAAHVTESYVSQLLARKKAPPAPMRTEIYRKMEVFLRLPRGELARLAEAQRKDELKKKAGDGPPEAEFPKRRAWMLRKCVAASRSAMAAIWEKESLGAIERLVARRLSEAAGLASCTDKDVPRLGKLIASWDFDLETFTLDIALSGKTASPHRRFAFVEVPCENGRGLAEFLQDKTLSGDATDEEIAFLKQLRPGRRRPLAIYFYRELQNLRDPVHFRG